MRQMIWAPLMVIGFAAAGCQSGSPTDNALRSAADGAGNVLESAGNGLENFSQSAGDSIENGFHAGVNKAREIGRDVADGPDGNRSTTTANTSGNSAQR